MQTCFIFLTYPPFKLNAFGTTTVTNQPNKFRNQTKSGRLTKLPVSVSYSLPGPKLSHLQNMNEDTKNDVSILLFPPTFVSIFTEQIEQTC